MADKTTTLKTKTNDNVYPNVIGDNRDNAIVDSSHIKHTLTADHKINFRLDTNVSGLIFNSLQKPTGLTKTKLVGVGTKGQENIEIGDNLTLANGKLSASGGGGSISVIELTDKNGTIASTQLGEITANPQNFTFKYKGKILLFTKADSTTYQYCNNTTSSSDNNVMTTSTLLTITSSTGDYTIAENVHNVVANSIHPANGGDLTNIQVGSKVYSIPSGGGGTKIIVQRNKYFNFPIEPGTYSRTNPVIVNRYFSYAEAIINITTEKPYEPKGDMYADGIYWNVIWYADSNNIESAWVVAYPTNGEHTVTKEITATVEFRLAYIPKA